MRIHIITFIFLFLQFVGCSQQVKKEDNNNASEIVKLKYASLLKIMKGEDFFRVEILNPADTTKVMHSYLITDKNPKSNKNQNYDCSPSFPSQLEWKIGLAWANTRGILNSPS